MQIPEALAAATAAGDPVALATVIESSSGAPARPGFKLLVYADGRATGNVGGGELETRIREAARETLSRGAPRTAHYSLTEAGPDATGMLCGGEVTVFLEPYLPRPVLLIVGGGHIGRPLAALAAVLDYDVRVVDSDPHRATVPALDPETITPHTHVVIITEDHESDEAVLRRVVETPAAYVGMIGSRHKVDVILDHLRAVGVPETAIARVHAPIGLDLGGRLPEQIALAILAEIEMVRHGGTPCPRSTTPGRSAAAAAAAATAR
ncbi:MAG TPA: XdhC/CoxI family protein [Chloroflexota bacterium]|nr:XdhC/CoxI family protein [Chloroflexota bacterium]